MNTEALFTVAMLLLCLALIAYGIRQWVIMIKTLHLLYVMRVRRKFDEMMAELEQYELAALDMATVAWNEYGQTVKVEVERKSTVRDEIIDFIESATGFVFERPNAVRIAFTAFVIRIAVQPRLDKAERYVAKHRKHLFQDDVEFFDDIVAKSDTMLLEAEAEVIDLGFDLAKIQTEYVDKIAV